MFLESSSRWADSIVLSRQPKPRYLEDTRMNEVELLEVLVELGQYQVGLLSFVCGVLTAYVFVFGMKLR